MEISGINHVSPVTVSTASNFQHSNCQLRPSIIRISWCQKELSFINYGPMRPAVIVFTSWTRDFSVFISKYNVFKLEILFTFWTIWCMPVSCFIKIRGRPYSNIPQHGKCWCRETRETNLTLKLKSEWESMESITCHLSLVAVFRFGVYCKASHDSHVYWATWPRWMSNSRKSNRLFGLLLSIVEHATIIATSSVTVLSGIKIDPD